ERLANRLDIHGIVDSFTLSEDYNIVEARVPARFAGKKIEEVGFRKNYNIVVLASVKQREERSLLGVKRMVTEVKEVATYDTFLEENDILVLYGNIDDIKRFMRG